VRLISQFGDHAEDPLPSFLFDSRFCIQNPADSLDGNFGGTCHVVDRYFSTRFSRRRNPTFFDHHFLYLERIRTVSPKIDRMEKHQGHTQHEIPPEIGFSHPAGIPW
jgi:hypothetical protein